MADLDFATKQRLSNLENAQGELRQMTARLEQSMNNVQSSVDGMNTSLSALRDQFEAFRKEQARERAIDRATTEIVRVRQELDQKFSNYSVVRETMLGVLQATDLALVKKDTISRVSEELMLSTPEYWLAPCLVAVAAWIGNDRDLATRAISEAVKRDEAKTALTMALICRRNGRQNTCYEWLSIYFSHQDSGNFSEATLLYIDAYVNGVFGVDEKHICDDYITKWMNEVRGNSSNIDADQERIWKEYCAGFSYDVSAQFPDLSQYVAEFSDIDAYIRRINSVGAIGENFSNMTAAVVNQDSLKANIDKRLIELIGRYDAKEEGLKKEEHYYDLVRRLSGDEQAAMQIVTREEQNRRERTLNLVEQMTHAVTTTEDVLPSIRKTAVTFLNGYIQKGFDSYITEKRADFPKQVTIRMDDWTGVAATGYEAEALCADYVNHMIPKREAEVAAAAYRPMRLYVGIAIAALCAVAMIFILPPAILLCAAGAGAWWLNCNAQKRNAANRQQEIMEEYKQRILAGEDKIRSICSQWIAAQTVVARFESTPTGRIVA